MTCSNVAEKLQDHVDGALSGDEVRALNEHLAACSACRAELESLRRLRAAAQALPREIAPGRDLWAELAPRLKSAGSQAASRPAARVYRLLVPLGLAAAVVALVVFFARSAIDPGWNIATLEGTPRVDAVPVGREARLRHGHWLETDSTSRARIAVGAIGEVRLAPNSRMRLIATEKTNHRLELARGALEARIWAPPRLFFVDTPAAQVIDLGCAYTLSVGDDGSGELLVTTGYVALEHGNRESIVPSGLKCLTRRGAGPGTPFDPDAPELFRAALARFDFSDGESQNEALREVLGSARPQDEVSLWHLLARSAAEDRGAVFDVLARYSTPPAGVTREGIIAGQVSMRRTWGAALGLGPVM